MDTVVGRREKGACLLVLTEGLSRKEIILKTKNKTFKAVIETLEDYKKRLTNKELK